MIDRHQLLPPVHSLLRRWWGCSAKPPSRIPDHEQYHDHGYHTVPEAPVREIHRYLQLSCYARQPGEFVKPWPVVAATSSPNHQKGTPKQTEIEVVVCRIVGSEPALVAQLACALIKNHDPQHSVVLREPREVRSRRQGG